MKSEHEQVLEVDSCITDARRLYWYGISTRLGILDKEGKYVTSLPAAISIPALFNPPLGGKNLRLGVRIDDRTPVWSIILCLACRDAANERTKGSECIRGGLE